jgi:hypothetical protein
MQRREVFAEDKVNALIYFQCTLDTQYPEYGQLHRGQVASSCEASV